MAVFKVIPKEYKQFEDVKNLIHYLFDIRKEAGGYSDISAFYRIGQNPYNIQYYEMFASQWCYAHKVYKPDANRTFCYHYVLAFDQNCSTEYNAVKDHWKKILSILFQLSVFRNIHKLIVTHSNGLGVPDHIHIMIDSINYMTGTSTFFEYKNLKQEIGELLAMYGIALAGYSFERNGNIFLGDYSPSELYVTQRCIFDYS